MLTPALGSPLESTTPDPLLPIVDRPLTSFERYRLEKAIASKEAQAQAKLEMGLVEEAFALWYESLRLQRALGLAAELPALGRIGAIAWSENRRDHAEIISARLATIEQELPPDSPFWLELAKAYQQLRKWEEAISIYERLLAQSEAKQEILENLGQLYLAKFDYNNAAKVYTQLLEIARLESNSFSEGIYLQKLAEIYNEISNPANAIVIKEQLVATYTAKQQLAELASLKLSLGQDYQALNEITLASQNYQEAFDLAWSQQQYGLAAQAKAQQADLYHSAGELDQALEVYQELIDIYQQSYDFYGLMTTYDQIAKIYIAQNKYPEALKALEQGLKLAQSLNYEPAYFESQIAQIREKLTE